MKAQSYVAVDGQQDNLREEPSPKISSPPAERRGKWASWVENGWLLEIASIALGTGLIVALIVILRVYDGQPAPRFGDVLGTSLTINTVVAILSATSKAALLWPVTECISQLKWLWFAGQESRPLVDMATFDDASRSTWGGFELVRRTKFRSLATIGSVLMLFSLAIDPLSQQLVSFSSAAVPSEGQLNAVGRDTSVISEGLGSHGSIPTSKGWAEASGQSGSINMIRPGPRRNGYGAISDRAKRAIQRGLDNGGEMVQEIASFCPSTNCTFESYETLAVCTSFANVTSHLEWHEATTVNGTTEPGFSSLSKDMLISHQNCYLNASSTANLDEDIIARVDNPPFNFSGSIAFKNVSLPLVDMFVLYPEIVERVIVNENLNQTRSEFRAIEVLMEWCVQKRTTEVQSNNITTYILHETRNFTKYSNIGYLPNGKPVGGPGTEDIYLVALDTHSSTSYHLSQLLQGYVQGKEMQFYASSNAALTLFEPVNEVQQRNVMGEKQSSMFKSLKGQGEKGLERIFNNIAESMTNYMRGEDGEYFEGIQLRQVLVVQVRWPWIIAHAIFVGFSIILLVATIISQNISSLHGHAWKSSSLAVLHALDPSLQQASGGISVESQLSEEAAGQLVKLRKTEAFGWRLG